MARHKTMLKGISEAWIKAMVNYGMHICDPIIFGPGITLHYDRNTKVIQ